MEITQISHWDKPMDNAKLSPDGHTASTFGSVRSRTIHSQIAKSLLHTPTEVIAAVRKGIPISDSKLNALVTLVRELVRERGYAKGETIQKFLAAGYTKEHVMELLLGIALKTISNYLDHISPTPVDRAFAGESK